MYRVRLGKNGQVTLPKVIRDNYQLATGDLVRMIDLCNGTVEIILLKHSRELPPPVAKVRIKVSVKQMKEGIKRIAGARHNRKAGVRVVYPG